MEPVNYTPESNTYYTPVEEFLQDCFESDLELNELASQIDDALSQLETMRKEDPDSTKHNRATISEIIEPENPIMARLIKKMPPDFDELEPALVVLIDENPKVKEHHNVIFDENNEPRPGKMNGLNVVKMVLLRMRPLLVYALSSDLRAVEDFNRNDNEAAA